MKKALFVLALVICLTLAACGDTAIDKQLPPAADGTQDTLTQGDLSEDASGADNTADGAASGVIPYNELKTDMFPSRETRTNSDGRVVTDIRYTYDSEGRVVSAINADGSGYKYEYPDNSTEITYYLSAGEKVDQKLVCEYDGKHQLMSSLCYDKDGKLLGDGLSFSYVYSEPNMISQIKQYTTDIEHYNTTDFEYSGENVTKKTQKDDKGNILSVEEYEFDEQGRMTSSSEKDYTTDWESSAKYEHYQDENGNTVTVCYKDGSGIPNYKNIFDSEGRLVFDTNYDDEGNEFIKTEVTRDGDSEVTATYISGVISSKTESKGDYYVRWEVYDSEGKLDSYTITEKTSTATTHSHYDSENNFISKDVYEYGADGRPLSTINYDAQGNATPYNVYTYDENNLLIKEENVYGAGDADSSVVTYEYVKIEGAYRTLENPYGHD